MFGESLSYPRRGDDWLKTILIGGVLSLLGVLVLPSLLVQGYLVRVLRSAARNEREAPAFEDWVDLLVDGIKVLVVQLVYVIVPAIVLLVGLFLAGAGALSASQGSGFGTGVGALGGIVLFVGVLSVLVAAYLIPAAVANFAYHDDFGAAFDFATVRRAAFTADYFVAVALAVVLVVVLGVVGSLLMFVLVGAFVLFYMQVAVYYLLGRGYAKGLDLDGSAAASP